MAWLKSVAAKLMILLNWIKGNWDWLWIVIVAVVVGLFVVRLIRWAFFK